MPTDAVVIRIIEKEEIPLVKGLPPREWTIDLDTIYQRHYGNDYAHPIVATIGTEIVGTGLAIINGKAAWLGTIIVKDTHRRMGIGRMITEYLIQYSRSRGCASIMLMASELGLPIYLKLGFEHDRNYLFFRNDAPIAAEVLNGTVRDIARGDHERILELDRSVTGEDRREVLLNAIHGGVVYTNAGIEGYYLPEFGRGVVIADTVQAGSALLRFKLFHHPAPVCLPETNTAGIDFLRSLGFVQYSQIPRLFLGENVEWKSEHIYSRGSGYMG